MKFDVDEIKRRVTLLALLERDGVAVRKQGASLVACCPIHQEKTPSFHVHEKAEGDWFRCFGCGAGGTIIDYWAGTRGLDAKRDFQQIVEALAAIAGMGSVTPAPLPKREARVEDDTPVLPLGEDELRSWERAAAEIYTDREEIQRIASWRGFRPGLVEWAARRLLIGRVVNRGAWREAFLIQRMVTPEPEGEEPAKTVLEAIGWHVRLAPRSRGNDSDKASWRYEPRKGLGAWPFVVLPEGGLAAARYLFFLEGQWDALALVDLMEWDKAWPREVAVFGMRGSTSWKRILDVPLRRDALAYLIADNDGAGGGWFMRGGPFPSWLKIKAKTDPVAAELWERVDRDGAPAAWAPVDEWRRFLSSSSFDRYWSEWNTQRADKDPSFSECLSRKVKRAFAWWPAAEGGDFNDLVRKLDEEGREHVRRQLRERTPRPRGKRGPTFHVWLKGQRKRTDAVGQFAAAIAGASLLGRKRLSVWRYHVASRLKLSAEMRDALEVAWEEWSKSTAEK